MLLTAPATRLVSLVRRGEISAVELVHAHLHRIASSAGILNAFVDVCAESALVEARAQDRRAARGEPRGPLGGLPVSVKSAIEVKGLRCESGSPTRRGRRATGDAAVVSRLRQAGAIVLGTTNVAEMLMGYETDNPIYGRTCNPWDVSRTPGGSSGGEAAAIAAGCSAAGIGSDGGGSIRVPAHFSGICGFKPTPGRIPSTGHQPACLGPFSLIGVVGPMARTVADLRLMDRVLSGYDDGDPMSVPGPGRARAERGGRPAARRVRVAWFEDDGEVPVTAETRVALRTAVRAAADAGFDVERYRPPALADAARLWDVFFAEAGLLALHDECGGAERDLPILRAHLDRSSRRVLGSAHELIDAWARRDQLRTRWASELGPARVVVCPVAAVPAFVHGERAWDVDGQKVDYLDAMRYSQWFNVLGAPAVVVPAGRTAAGLPIGVQVAGRPFDDELVLEVAEAIERGCGGYRPPPGFDDA